MGKKSAGSGSGYFAPSNAGEDDRHGAIRDKKFEGYSNLKGSHEMQQKRTHKQNENQVAKHLEEEYILNMQRQIVLMETEIKLLKDREVD